MAKHIYHLPLEKVKTFIKDNKATLNEVQNDKYIFEYRKNFGKSYYDLELEKFIEFFKINKNHSYAIKNIKYFTSDKFLQELYKLINIEQFKLDNIKQREFFYNFVFTLQKKDKELFFHKIFLHFHTSINESSNINIDYQDLSKTIAKNRNIKLKESFGEGEDKKSVTTHPSYFTLINPNKIHQKTHQNIS